tara:strand:- start:1221 stop:1529 length:309 start_codon:yes stop_codon:yes gene_type:complete
MPYNLTGIGQNSSNVIGFIQGVNDNLVFGWLGLFILIGVSLVAYMSFVSLTGDSQKSLVATGFISFVLCLLFTAAGLIGNPLIMFACLLISGLTVAFSSRGN